MLHTLWAQLRKEEEEEEEEESEMELEQEESEEEETEEEEGEEDEEGEEEEEGGEGEDDGEEEEEVEKGPGTVRLYLGGMPETLTEKLLLTRFKPFDDIKVPALASPVIRATLAFREC